MLRVYADVYNLQMPPILKYDRLTIKRCRNYNKILGQVNSRPNNHTVTAKAAVEVPASFPAARECRLKMKCC
jgi:hypothetical protein